MISDTPKRAWLNRTVIGAGITSALGDVTYESANAILPGFFAALGIPAATLGAIEGAADALASFSKLGAGYIADRVGHRKTLVVVGYTLTTLMMGFFATATGPPGILAGRIVGWFGRGIRGPLRDAILAQAITEETRGRAFGFHRAADSVGAIVGPLVGVALLAWMQQRMVSGAAAPFRVVFWLMLVPGIGSVISFMWLVQDPEASPNPGLRFWRTIAALPSDFRQYLAAVGVFGVGDFAHTLLILAATQLLAPRLGTTRAAAVAGLLYVGRNAVQTAASLPIGALADRVGHKRVLTIGYLLAVVTAAVVSAAFMRPDAAAVLLVMAFAAAGLYTAIEEALESTIAAEHVPVAVRGIGFGVLGSVNGLGDFVSSTAVGALWTSTSPSIAFGAAAVVMAIGTGAMMAVPSRR